ncbi:MAG: hypothetical protein IT426_09335 [Pirellulales bacterium]|nr:hypothetical protein [Pirellulales bacterium]
MRSRFASLGMTAGFLLMMPAAAQAGMPSISITDWAALRFETLSFFILVLLVAAAVVRWLWHILAADFPKLPRLTYRKSLAGVVLIGLALAVVLTMIAGSRELLTPGAWVKDGRLYKIAATKKTSSDEARQPQTAAEKEPYSGSLPSADRKKQLDRLYAALSEYAAKHEGRFPNRDAVKEIEESLWEMPGTNGMRYLYVSGLNANDSDKILAYEPEFSGGERGALMANGKIRFLNSEEIRRKLQEDRP